MAGGGSFISFPALLLSGITPIVANATNAVALWPAGVASAIAYRRELDVHRRVLALLVAVSLAGGLLGALWLLRTPDATFVRQLPWLLLAATLTFTFDRWLSARIGTNGGLAVTCIAQFVISIYGGYFGGGMGILMLAALSIMEMRNIHSMNGLKSLLGVAINGIAVVAFIAGRAVAWAPGLVMIAGATLGGYAGATIARRIPPEWMRRFVIFVAWTLTAYFFWRAR